MSTATVTHCAEIIRVEKDAVVVSIAQRSACAHCQVAAFCASIDTQEREVRVPITSIPLTHYRVGDKVRLTAQERMGWQAIGWALAIPIVLLLLSVVLGDKLFHWAEWLIALIAVSVLGLYGVVLYLLRNRFQKQFEYSLTSDSMI